MTTFSEEVKKLWDDFVAEFKRRRKEMTMVDETVVPDEPSEADKPEGWRDPAEADPEVTPGGTTPGEHSPGEVPDRGDRAPGEDPERNPDEEVDPHGAPPETEPGEDTGELDLSEIAQQVIEGKWGTGQERRQALSKAGWTVKDVEAEVNRRLNKR